MSKDAGTPPSISPDLQRLLDKQLQNRIAEEDIRDRINQFSDTVLAAYPEQAELFTNMLEGCAQRIRSELEAKKREERRGSK